MEPARVLRSSLDPLAIERISSPDPCRVAPPEFTSTTHVDYKAEVANVEGDLVFHFFLPDRWAAHFEAPPVKRYWKEIFPEVLQDVAKEHFKADHPRLVAQFISDYALNSWWFKANKFGDTLLDWEAFAKQFYVKLSAELDKRKST